MLEALNRMSVMLQAMLSLVATTMRIRVAGVVGAAALLPPSGVFITTQTPKRKRSAEEPMNHTFVRLLAILSQVAAMQHILVVVVVGAAHHLLLPPRPRRPAVFRLL